MLKNSIQRFIWVYLQIILHGLKMTAWNFTVTIFHLILLRVSITAAISDYKTSGGTGASTGDQLK